MWSLCARGRELTQMIRELSAVAEGAKYCGKWELNPSKGGGNAGVKLGCRLNVRLKNTRKC